MNKIRTFMIGVISLALISCEDYLDKTPYSEITDENVFVNFKDFQAFIEINYSRVTDYNNFDQNSSTCFSDAAISLGGIHFHVQQGNYWNLYRGASTGSGALVVAKRQNPILDAANASSGLWPDTWKSLRANNLALEKLDMLEGTPRQKELIEGQARFFRAFFVSELSKWVGGLPYIKRTLDPNEQFSEQRLSPMATMDEAAVDFDLAAQLLPMSWDDLSKVDHPYQAYDPSTGVSSNTGRATKGAAYAMKSLAMLWAGSPLSNYASKGHVRPDGQTVSGTYTYDPYYMEEAAKAAYEVIKLAEENDVYQLVGMDEFQSFTVQLRQNPWVSPSGKREVIWAKVQQGFTNNNDNGKRWCPQGIGVSVGYNVNATANQVDRFEMINGLPILDDLSGYDPQNPFANRDPRLNASVILPNEIIFGTQRLTSWRTGQSRSRMGSSFLVRKYLLASHAQSGVNLNVLTPYARLAEMYLVYAEGINEVYGPNTKPSWANYTAVEALNKVRSRAKSLDPLKAGYLVPIMPPVNVKFTTSKELLRARIHNERDVELAYEAKRWFDVRRWHEGTLPENLNLYSMEMDLAGNNLTNFTKELQAVKVFEEKHYWVPIPQEQAQISEGFHQTVGW